MGENSGIAWTNHTFSPWWGCVKVSPACDNCYAATFDARFAGDTPHWGAEAPRRFLSDKHWNSPLKWDRAAQASGKRTLVFCASMADVFESGRTDLEPWRTRLWALIKATPNLTWLLLTKRPQNIGRMLAPELVGTHNIWLGTTIESPAFLWRADALIQFGQQAPVRFVSMEPLIEETSILPKLGSERASLKGINWVITGCESGAGARPTPTDWYRQLRDECGPRYRDPTIPFFLKQAPKTAEGITQGAGSWLKLKEMLVEQPYLDGIQHVEFPA